MDKMITVILDISAVGLASVTLFMLARQKGSFAKSTHKLLIGSYLLLSSTIILDFLRDLLESVEISPFLTSLAVSATLAATVPATLAAITLTHAPSTGSIRDAFVKTLGGSRKHTLSFTLNAILVTVVSGAAWLLKPFSFEFVQVDDGRIIYPIIEGWYSLAIFLILIIFIAYPCRLLIQKGRSSSSKAVARTSMFLAISWVMIALSLYVFKIYLVSLGGATSALGSLLSTIPWMVAVHFFRSQTALESFFSEPVATKEAIQVKTGSFSGRLGLTRQEILGKKILFEYDPSSNYAGLVREFAFEASTEGEVLVVTRNGSPVSSALAGVRRLRLLYLTRTVSYPKEGSSQNEILLPYDPAIMHGAIAKGLKANLSSQITLVFDVLSDLIFSYGNSKAYQFLIESLELTSEHRVSCIYLLNASAHDPKIVSSIKGLFSIHVGNSGGTLRLAKSQ